MILRSNNTDHIWHYWTDNIAVTLSLASRHRERENTRERRQRARGLSAANNGETLGNLSEKY